jgi:hypothetical protein
VRALQVSVSVLPERGPVLLVPGAGVHGRHQPEPSAPRSIDKLRRHPCEGPDDRLVLVLVVSVAVDCGLFL